MICIMITNILTDEAWLKTEGAACFYAMIAVACPWLIEGHCLSRVFKSITLLFAWLSQLIWPFLVITLSFMVTRHWARASANSCVVSYTKAPLEGKDGRVWMVWLPQKGEVFLISTKMHMVYPWPWLQEGGGSSLSDHGVLESPICVLFATFSFIGRWQHHCEYSKLPEHSLWASSLPISLHPTSLLAPASI